MFIFSDCSLNVESSLFLVTVFGFFWAFDFCRFCVVIRFFHPRHYGQWPPTSKDFYTRSYPLHYFLILILQKEPVFPFSMLSGNKGTTGTIFITSLVWRGPWLGIEPGTSPTRSQHYITRLSRRRSLTEDWTRTFALEASTISLGYRGGDLKECFSKMAPELYCRSFLTTIIVFLCFLYRYSPVHDHSVWSDLQRGHIQTAVYYT